MVGGVMQRGWRRAPAVVRGTGLGNGCWGGPPSLLNGRRGPCGPCVGGPGVRELRRSPAAAIAGKSVYLRGRSPAQNPCAQGSKPWMVAAVTLLAPRRSSCGGFDGGGGLGVRDHGGAEDLCGVATLSEGGG